MIPEEFRKFGLVTIPSHSPCCFWIWENDHYCYTMQTSGQPQRAYWSGDSIIVEMEDHVRVYHGLGTTDYKKVYL
jgi:hypothetical protein